MKICPGCGTANPEGSLQCKDCGHSLTAAGIKNAQIVREGELKRIAGKERRNNRLRWAGFALLMALFCSGLVTAGIRGLSIGFFLVFLLIPVMSYVGLFHPEALFRFSYMFAIRNVEEAEPSEWYLFSTRLTSVALLGVTGVVLLVAALSG